MGRRDSFDYLTFPVVLLVFSLFAGMLVVFFTNAVPAFHRFGGVDVYLKTCGKPLRFRRTRFTG